MNAISIRLSSVLLISSIFLNAQQRNPSLLLLSKSKQQLLNYEEFFYSSLDHTNSNYEKYEDEELEKLEERIQEKRSSIPNKSLKELNSPIFYLNDQNTLQCNFPIKEYTLRTIVLDDFASFKKLRADPLTMSFMAGGTQDEASSKARFDILLHRMNNNNPMAWLTLINNQTKDVLGFAALGLPSNREPGVGELIVFFEPNTQAKGLGTLMLQECLLRFGPEVARLGREGFAEFQCFFGKPLYKIFAAINPQNILARKILEKSQMKPTLEKKKDPLKQEPIDPIQKNSYSNPVICFEYLIP